METGTLTIFQTFRTGSIPVEFKIQQMFRSERLNTSSDLFRSESSRLRRNASDLRLRVGLGVGLVVLVVVIIIISTL